MNKDEIIENILLELKQLKETIVKQDRIIQSLQKENKKLKEIINKDSTNSSKPPSTDSSFKDKNDTTNEGSKKKQKRGGQKGSTSNNLKKVDNPDIVKILEVSNCTNCNFTLKDIDAVSISTKQTFDIPKIKMEVTEFQQHNKVCPCCNSVNKPDFPNDLNSYVQYGDNIKTFIAYLNTYQMIPYARIAELVEDFTSHKISSGTIYRILDSFYDKLEPFETKCKDLLLKSTVINIDETGTRVKDKLHWTHTISTSSITYYMIHQKRGCEAIDDMEILPYFKGIAVHDHWKPYNSYDCTHSYCNAHHLRELIGIVQNEDVRWAKDMHILLTSMNDYIYKLKEKGKLSPSKGKIEQFFQQYDDICQSAQKFYPPPTQPPRTRRKSKQSKGKNLLDRFIKYKDEILRFFTNLSVPFTNNLAERDLRMIKVKEKISGCFASFKGAEIFNRIRGYISTVKKNNKSVLEELGNVLNGKVYIPVLIGC